MAEVAKTADAVMYEDLSPQQYEAARAFLAQPGNDISCEYSEHDSTWIKLVGSPTDAQQQAFEAALS